MANHKSAIKRNRQNEKRKAQNAGARAAVRTAIKKVRSLVEEGAKDGAKEALHAAEKIIKKAAGHGLYHQKNADRKVSRLAKAVVAIN